MLELYEILDKMYKDNGLTEEEKFKILHSKKTNPKVLDYLKERLKPLYIEVLGKYEGNIFELMRERKLEGWCWQTTESAIFFLNDDDYIERGDLYFDERTPAYYHSWICFKFDGIEYVFDPCLNFLCKKNFYHKIFDVNVKAIIYAKDVKEELLKEINTPKDETSIEYQRLFCALKSILGSDYEKQKDRLENEVVIRAKDDINTPLYRNGAGYRADLDNNMVRSLKVHYYYTDM